MIAVNSTAVFSPVDYTSELVQKFSGCFLHYLSTEDRFKILLKKSKNRHYKVICIIRTILSHKDMI